jgi:hypothetical protein
MRIQSLIVLPAIAMAFSGCIYYEGEDDGYGCSAGDCANGGSTETADEVLLAFAPDHVDVGAEFIGYLSDETGETDMNSVVDVQFYGDVASSSWDTRTDEVILSLSVDPAAVEGEVDIVVVFEDGSTAWLDAAFSILPSGDRSLDNDGSEEGEGSSEEEGEDSEQDPSVDDCD